MSDFVELFWKRNRGWPWPEASWGLTPMFGETGWCRGCGTPTGSQIGSLVLQSKGMSTAVGAWMPNWLSDVICLEGSIAREVERRFDVELRAVEWHHTPRGEAAQIVVPTVGDAWFDAAALTEATVAVHGEAGRRCEECGTWRWMPLPSEALPPHRRNTSWSGRDIIASPEWFGDGSKSFRQILVDRELAGFLAAASPRDFEVREPR